MAKNKLFQDLDLNHKPKRNGYDLGHNVRFSAKSGEILPVFHRTAMPGDHFEMSFSMFTRTAPVIASPHTIIREYIDVFFVPYRILWKGSQQVHTNNKKNPAVALSPSSNRSVGEYTPRFDSWQFRRPTDDPDNPSGVLTNLSRKWNSFGLNRGLLAGKLYNHMQYGYLTNDDLHGYANDTIESDPLVTPQYLSLYPWLAYQCIYYKFFRNSQWEDNVPYNYNVDYLSANGIVDLSLLNYSGPTMFDLQYSNYPRDLFFGMFPDAQLGDEAVVDVTSDSDSGTLYGKTVLGNDAALSIQDIPGMEGFEPKGLGTSNPDDPLAEGYSPFIKGLNSTFGILELRKAQFEQRYKEILGSGQNEYKTIIRKIFGIDVPDTLADMPVYLGGHTNTIEWNTQVNSNLQGQNPDAPESNRATITATGAGSSQSDKISYDVKEHGIFMAVYHAQPVIDYALNALHFDAVKTEFDDYANPVFDQLGFEEIPAYFLNVSRAVFENIPEAGDPTFYGLTFGTLGYTNRYFDYKTSIDQTLGNFRESQSYWLAPVNFDYLKNFIVSKRNPNGSVTYSMDLNANFFKVDPHLLDPIFYVKTSNGVPSDQLEVSLNLNIHTVRPLDYHGVPY